MLLSAPKCSSFPSPNLAVIKRQAIGNHPTSPLSLINLYVYVDSSAPSRTLAPLDYTHRLSVAEYAYSRRIYDREMKKTANITTLMALYIIFIKLFPLYFICVHKMSSIYYDIEFQVRTSWNRRRRRNVLLCSILERSKLCFERSGKYALSREADSPKSNLWKYCLQRNVIFLKNVFAKNTDFESLMWAQQFRTRFNKVRMLQHRSEVK